MRLTHLPEGEKTFSAHTPRFAIKGEQFWKQEHVLWLRGSNLKGSD